MPMLALLIAMHANLDTRMEIDPSWYGGDMRINQWYGTPFVCATTSPPYCIETDD